MGHSRAGRSIISHRIAPESEDWFLGAQGIANLRGLEVEQLETLPAPGGGSFIVLLGESVHTASRALLFPTWRQNSQAGKSERSSDG